MITGSEVRAAAARIAGHVRVTPLIEADERAFPPAARVWLKLEQLPVHRVVQGTRRVQPHPVRRRAGHAARDRGGGRLGDIAYAVAARTGVRSVLVSDADIIAARQQLWEKYRLAVEHGGATALAALLAGAYRPAEGERIVVVVCGANTDPATLT
jgi:threonine dehydratase